MNWLNLHRKNVILEEEKNILKNNNIIIFSEVDTNKKTKCLFKYFKVRMISKSNEERIKV